MKKIKHNHNKKRNTAFVFEALIREATVAIIKQDNNRKNKVLSIIKKHFTVGSELYTDLECYRSLYEGIAPTKEIANKILSEVRSQKRLIDPEGLFIQQTKLINDINKELSPETFNNFVPSYRSLAAIQQMMSVKSSPKRKIMLEREIVKNMIVVKEDKDEMPTIDNITYKNFVNKFNKKYNSKLLKEQRDLLTYYVTSFSDNSLQLKIFLNNEIERLKSNLQEAENLSYIKEDQDMLKKLKLIIEKLQSFSKETINENILLTVLTSQSLIEEINNGDND